MLPFKIFHSRLILIGLFFYIGLKQCNGQQFLMERRLVNDTVFPVFGPNMKKFNHTYLNFGFPVPDNKILKPFINYDFSFGFRRKRKWNEVFSAGYNLALSYRHLRIKDTTTFYPLYPGATLIKEKIIQKCLSLAPYLRINFGHPRGNFLGYFVDIAAYGEWSFANAHLYIFENPPQTPVGEKGKYIFRRLPWLNKWNYGLLLQLGYDKLVIFARYRISDTILAGKQAQVSEWPRLTCGLQVAMFK